MSYAFRGLTRSDAITAFTGDRADRSTGEIIMPRVSPNGRTRLMRDRLTGATLGMTLSPRNAVLVWVDSSLGRLVGGDEVLMPAGRVGHGEHVARATASRLGVNLERCVATVRRFDLTTDLRFDLPVTGLAFLRGVSHLSLPTFKVEIHMASGSTVVESVAWENRAGVQLRIYDKSAERGRGRGEVIRIERQRRPRTRAQVAPARFESLDHRAMFGDYLARWTFEHLVIAPPLDAYALLKGRVGMRLPGRTKAGERRLLTERVAERMLGTLMQLYMEGDAAWLNPRTARDRRRELRAAGIEIDADAGSIVHIGQFLTSAIEVWSQAC